jgi:polysaccharide chain length determinant protein (PEP-CTERM system associated)
MHEQLSQDSGLHQALEVWRRRRWLSILVFLGTFVPAVSFVVFLPDVYRSTATVLVERQQEPETLARTSATEDLDTRLHTISQEILSRARLNDLIRRFDLYPAMRRKAAAETAIERMRRDIEVDLKGAERSWGRGATIAFALTYRGRDPRKVAQVANALAAFYVEENEQIRERQASQAAGLLKSQLEEVKGKLEEQERRIGEFKMRHTGELPQQVEANLATLERLNAQLHLNSERQIRAMERRESLGKQIAEADGVGPAGDPEGTAARIARLSQELNDLRRRFSDKYPDVIRVEQEIAVLRQQLAAAGTAAGPEAGGSAAVARGAGAVPPDPALLPLREAARKADAEVGGLKSEEERLRRTVAAYERRVENAPQRQQEFHALSRDYETTKDLYDSLLKRHEEAALAESLEQGRTAEQFRILDQALPPREPSAPGRLWLSVMGLIVSIGMAVGAMALAERLDTSFHSVDALRAFTRVPVLASIPPIVSRADARRRLLRASTAAASVALGLTLIAGASSYVAREYESLVWILSGSRP